MNTELIRMALEIAHENTEGLRAMMRLAHGRTTLKNKWEDEMCEDELKTISAALAELGRAGAKPAGMGGLSPCGGVQFGVV